MSIREFMTTGVALPYIICPSVFDTSMTMGCKLRTAMKTVKHAAVAKVFDESGFGLGAVAGFGRSG